MFSDIQPLASGMRRDAMLRPPCGFTFAFMASGPSSSTNSSMRCESCAKPWVSRPMELHHRPLVEPSVKLSSHSAPIRQTSRSYRWPVNEQIPARATSAKADPTRVPAPVTAADRIVLEIRKFIAAAIFFNAQAAEKVGLGLTDMQIVHMLALNGPSTPTRLSAWTGLSSGRITVALDRLEKAGYVRREANLADRRSLLVTLVPARMRKLAAMYKGVESETRRLLATLPQHDLDAVIRFFETLRAARMESKALLQPQPRSHGNRS